MLTAMFKVEGVGASGQFGGQGNPVATMEQNFPAIQSSVVAGAKTLAEKYGLDPDEVAQAALGRVDTVYGRTREAYDQQNQANQGQLLSIIDKGGADGEPFSDKSALFAVPGAAALYAQLGPAQQHYIDDSLYRNGNQTNPTRMQNRAYWETQARNPDTQQQFAATDIASSPYGDMTSADKSAVLGMQAQVRGEIAKGQERDTRFAQISGLPQIDAGLRGLNFPTINNATGPNAKIDKSSFLYNAFTGMLMTDMTQWKKDNPTKTLDDQTVISMAAKLQAQRDRFSTNPNAVLGQAQPDEIKTTVEWFQQQFHRAPNPEEIGEYIERARMVAAKREGRPY